MFSKFFKRSAHSGNNNSNSNMSGTTRVMHGDTVIAETSTDKIVRVEGNAYFPADAIIATHFTDSDHTTVCGWKGTAKYKHVTGSDGQTLQNAAWYYPEPKAAANNIKGYYAFYQTHLKVVE